MPAAKGKSPMFSVSTAIPGGAEKRVSEGLRKRAGRRIPVLVRGVHISIPLH